MLGQSRWLLRGTAAMEMAVVVVVVAAVGGGLCCVAGRSRQPTA
jgi:hypothetical protein